jgi:hypothetical protein
LIVLVLAAAAAGAGIMVLGRTQSSSDAAPGPQTTTGTTTGATAGTHAPSAVTPARTRPRVVPRDQLPAAIRLAFTANHVVVVALYDPKAKIDDTALREAAAGAHLAGTVFVPVDVTRNGVDSLNARYGVIQDPAVLVLRPPGDLIVRIDGFADRDTVAQAAANAAS